MLIKCSKIDFKYLKVKNDVSCYKIFALKFVKYFTILKLKKR